MAVRRRSTMPTEGRERRIDGAGRPWRDRLYAPENPDPWRAGAVSLVPEEPPDVERDPSRVFLDARHVMLRYGWGKTKGYQNLTNRSLVPHRR